MTKSFDGGPPAVDQLTLEIRDGEFMVLLGPSGCGKSTVLRMIAGLEEPSSGSVWFGRTEVHRMSPKERGVAMVFQNGALYPNRSVRDNILFPLQMAGEDPGEAAAKVGGLARILGIERTLDRLPRTLSGGERQRAAIGRAVVRQPIVSLMDEPLSNLDSAMRTELRQEIGAMARELKATTVYVTHDQVEALTLADRLAIMREGRIEDVGTPGQVYEDPATAFVAAFLGSPRINLVIATVQVEAHRRVVLDFGGQSLSLPRTDRRAQVLAHHDGARVVVGLRSEAVTIVDEGGEGNELSGRLRALEFHGHQWIAFVESGLELADPDTLGLLARRRRTRRTGLRQSTNGHRPGSRAEHAAEHLSVSTRARAAVVARIRPLFGLAVPVPLEPLLPPGGHRRSDLVLEVAAGQALALGQQVRLRVDITRIHVFDEEGRRVDRVVR
ncbi:ABC transporter ATP-binding protein [Kribbella sp. NPDC056861]|uniref:ABC transporter ATP-binding protein n=1 Tax=Kribbella sp. NPDC056861 TaxID=3154857 RepID=UPI00344A53A6